MRITVKGESIPLNNKEVKAAKKAVTMFLKKMKEHEEKYLRPSWYLTILIVMHTISGELLDEMDPDNLKRIFQKFS